MTKMKEKSDEIDLAFSEITEDAKLLFDNELKIIKTYIAEGKFKLTSAIESIIYSLITLILLLATLFYSIILILTSLNHWYINGLGSDTLNNLFFGSVLIFIVFSVIKLSFIYFKYKIYKKLRNS